MGVVWEVAPPQKAGSSWAETVLHPILEKWMWLQGHEAGLPAGWGTEWKGTRELRAGVFGEWVEELLHLVGRLLSTGNLS